MSFEQYIEPEGSFEREPPDKINDRLDVEEKVEQESADDETRLYASTGEVFAALETAFKDKKFYKKLRGQTLKWIRLYFFSECMDGHTAEDVINLTIFSLLKENGRKWYKARTPKIENLLLMAVPSVIRNYYKKKKPILTGIDIYNDSGELNEANIAELQRAYLRSDLHDELFRDQLEDLIAKLFKLLEKDKIATMVLEQLLETDHTQIKKPAAHIAQELKLEAEVVKKAIRRINRRIEKLFAK